MAKYSMMVGLLVMTTFLLSNRLVAATEYTVGGDLFGIPNWRPCCDRYDFASGCCTPDYSGWARENKFVVGDRLVFHFNVYYSTVMEVGEDAYNTCKNVPVRDAISTSPATLTLNSSGVKYFISPGRYCAFQRMTVDVEPDKNSPPPPAKEDNSSSDDSSQRIKIIAGVVGPVAAALVGAVVTGYCKYWRKKKQDKSKPDPSASGDKTNHATS